MLSSGQGAHGPVVRNVGARDPATVLLDQERHDRVLLRRRRVRLDERQRGGGGGGAREGRERRRRAWERGRGGEQRGEGVQLRFGELAHAQLVVQLQPRHDVARQSVRDAVVREQRNLRPSAPSTPRRRTLTSFRSGSTWPRRGGIDLARADSRSKKFHLLSPSTARWQTQRRQLPSSRTSRTI